MKNTVIWSLLSVVALGAGGLVAGCDSDAKLARSALGESCDNTADCDDGLKCIDSTCAKSGSSSSGGSSNLGEGGEPTTSGATAGTAPAVVPPVLGNEGESCTKRADCKDGLGCFSQRCQKSGGGGGGGEGGEGNIGPALGSIGETCTLTTDCTQGLACLPNSQGYGTSSGVCSSTSNGLEPTGKTCGGAECLTAEDCCELPIGMHATLGANSCTELADLLDGVDCDSPSAVEKPLCFAQSAYCECGATTWTCTDAGRCEYNAECDTATPGFVPGGCPTLSRAGYALVPTCDDDTSKCQNAVPDATCKKDADCVGVVPSDAAKKCITGDCTCFKETGSCYVKCGEDLDCKAGQTCDTKTHVCVDGAACTSDAFCATTMGVDYQCLDGVCEFSCDNDIDCNDGSLTNGTQTEVCNADHRCEPVGCSDDSECPGTTPDTEATNVRLFCTTPVATTAGAGVHSAVTD